MEAHDYDGNHQPDLELLVQRYEEMLQNGGVSFLEVDSFLMLSDYYEEENKFDLALDVLRHALEQHSFSATLHIRKAQILSEKEDYITAFKALEMASMYEPSDLDIYLTKADIYMRLHEQDKAIEVLQIAKEYANKEDLPDLYILESTIYESKKDYPNSLKYLKKALYKDPSNEIALSRLWIIYDLTKEYAAAITYHIDFINEQPYSYWAWYNLGLAYLNTGLFEKAAEAFDYSIVTNEHFEPAYHAYIDCLIALGEYDLAIRYLTEYQEFFEEDAELWYRMGQCYEFRLEYKTARLHYSKALDFSTLGGRVYYNIGHSYLEEEEWNLAEKAFSEAYNIDRFNEEYCLALADTYNALENSDKAHEFYHKALAVAPKEVTIWVHYIQFLLDEKSYSVAIEMLEDAEEYIDSPLLDYAKAATLLESGQRQEGFVVLGNALIENYDMHRELFSISPTLEEDNSIMAFILQHAKY